MSAETEKAHGAGMPPGFPELWESVTRARMDIAELKGMVKMHFSDKAHHTPPCATATGLQVMFAPEFDLKGIKEKRIVVVPAGIETKPNARDYLEDRLKVQVGILKKCTEDDVPALIREVVALGRRFLHKWVARVRCVKAECNPLYSPEHLRERRQFTGVVELTFLSVHRNEE